MGIGTTLPTASVLLPIGISFFTFEAISYLVDVKTGKIPAERNLVRFLLFITFFPHLIAGPIVRARDFLPQTVRRKHWDWARAELGLRFFLIGLFKKMAIADRMALFADPVFGNPIAYSSLAVWTATIAYTIQIYCDFSGYSDMAIGCAHLLGFKLGKNFDRPYLARSVSEFWRRWHISLSSWLRDYVYIPLGGNRRGEIRTSINLAATMVLGGLWHGANWTFVAWGVLHGFYAIVQKQFGDLRRRAGALDAACKTTAGGLVCWALTLFSVMLAWIFFRSPTFAGAAEMIRGLVVWRPGLAAPLPRESFWILLGLVVVGHLAGLAKPSFGNVRARIPAHAVGLGYAGLLTLALLLAPTTAKVFIYFQF